MVNHVRAKAAVFTMIYHERHEAARVRSPVCSIFQELDSFNWGQKVDKTHNYTSVDPKQM